MIVFILGLVFLIDNNVKTFYKRNSCLLVSRKLSKGVNVLRYLHIHIVGEFGLILDDFKVPLCLFVRSSKFNKLGWIFMIYPFLRNLL